MGAPKKTTALKDIENEMNDQTPETGEVTVSKVAPIKVEGSNEFGDEYTMTVIADNEPGADIFRIPNKDINFEYYFIRDEKDNISVKTSNLLFMKGGWQICPKTHLLRIGIEERNLHPDGSYHVGGHVLAFMPKALYEKKKAEDRRKSNAAMAGVKRLVEEGDTSRVNIPDVGGIKPGRMDGGRVVFDGKKKGSVRYGPHNSVED